MSYSCHPPEALSSHGLSVSCVSFQRSFTQVQRSLSVCMIQNTAPCVLSLDSIIVDILFQSVQAAVTECHILGGSNNTVPLGIRLQHTSLGETQTFSPQHISHPFTMNFLFCSCTYLANSLRTGV